MTEKPTVSVVIPTFNMSRCICDAVESVLNQTYKDFELIVVDDGSNDDTEHILQPYRGRICYFKQVNSGVSAARNRGIELARGQYVAFLDADDLWLPDKLKLQMQAFDRQKELALVACGYSVRSSDGKTAMRNVVRKNYPTRTELFNALSICQLIPGCASGVVVKKCCFSEIGSFDTTIKVGEDWDMWLRIVARYNAYFVEQILSVIRQTPGDKVGRSEKDEERFVQQVIEKTVKAEFKSRAKAALYARLGSSSLSAGKVTQARKWLAKSIASYPGFVFPLDFKNRYQYPKIWRLYLLGKCIFKSIIKREREHILQCYIGLF